MPTARSLAYSRNRLKLRLERLQEWGEMSAYYLGYFWADGNVRDGPGYQLQLECKREDEELILGFREWIGSDAKIYRREKSPGRGRCTKVTVCGYDLVRILVDKYGILPNKSKLNEGFPVVPNEWLPSFLLGYFDGDGCVSVFKRFGEGEVSFNGGEAFIQGIRDHLVSCLGIREAPVKRVGQKQFWRARWGSIYDIGQIGQYLYAGNRLGLRRKREVFAQLAV